jgi:hypothetical protein
MNPDENVNSDEPAVGEGIAPAPRRKWRRRLAIALRAGLSITAIVLLMLWILGAFRKERIQPGRRRFPRKRPTASLRGQSP